MDMIDARGGDLNANLFVGFADRRRVYGFASIKATGGNAEGAVHPAGACA
jgi:hypothetical protein